MDSTSGDSLDPFDAGSWQHNLIFSLTERFSAQFFQEKLTDARSFTRVMRRPWPQELIRKVYSAHGEGSDTWRQVAVDTHRKNFYLFDKAVSEDKGDGTVHRLSSTQPEITNWNRIYVDKKHFLDRVAGQHANMPNHSGLQDWVLGVLRMNPHAGHHFESPV